MSKPNATVLTPELQSAFLALEAYASGGKRSALLPIDQAVIRSLEEPKLKQALEEGLLKALSSQAPYPAKQYACGKLALIGSRASVSALGCLLGDPKVASDARSALEAIQDESASKILLAEMKNLGGLEKAGAIHSLAVCRYKPAVSTIRKELVNPEAEIRRAATRALEMLSAG